MPASRSPRARRTQCGTIPRCSRPISATASMRDRPRAAALAPARAMRCLTARELDGRLWRGAGAAGIDLEVRQGELVALLGANGAGKSTTMRALCGLLRPVAGDDPSSATSDRARWPPTASRGAGWCWCPRAGRFFPSSRVLDNLHARRLCTPQDDAEHEVEAHARALSAARERARTAAPDCCPAASSRCWRSRAA